MNAPRPLRGVYAITDEALLPADLLLTRVEAALRAGLALLQFRSKLGSASERLRQAQALVDLCRHYDTPLLINDDIALCQRVGAAGVHLGQQDKGIAQARQLLGPDAIIGITCHAQLSLARQAQAAGASYVAFGRFFASHTKPSAPPADIAILPQARRELHIPVVAIGGITAENGAALIAAGADMLAVIHALFAFPDVESRTLKLNSLFTSPH
jgi:thiamine-phosphate pyrophosphorylase